MTTSKESPATRNNSQLINRFLYGTFVLLSIYFFFKNDASTAISNLGTALIFDPFDPKVIWNNRPAYQKIWLIAHVSSMFSLIGIVAFHYFIKA